MAEGRSNPILKDRCVDVDFGQRKVVLLTLYENIFISRFGERNIWNVSSALAGFAELLLVSSYALCSMGLARHFAVAENGRRSGMFSALGSGPRSSGSSVRTKTSRSI